MQTFQYSKTLRKKPSRFSTDTCTHHNHLPSHLSRAVCAGSPCDRAVRVLCKAAVTGVCWGQISFPWSCQALSAVITMICHDTAPGKVQVCLLQDQIFAVGQCRWTITYHVYKCHGDRLTLLDMKVSVIILGVQVGSAALLPHSRNLLGSQQEPSWLSLVTFLNLHDINS